MIFGLIFLGILGFAYFQFPAVQSFVYFSSCDKPIPYKIGSIDSRFKISEGELHQDIEKGAQVWEQALDKNLFEFDQSAKLTINMVYDERQYLASKLDQLGNSLDELGDEVNSIETSLTDKKNTLSQQADKFKDDSEAFKNQFEQYKEDVQYWNNQGGAPPDEYQKIKGQQAELKLKQQQLSEQAQALRQQTQNYNGDVEQLNNAINDYNNQAGNFNNTVGTFKQTVKLHPEEGLYDEGKKTIDIYYNVTEDELVHTLAHELGHAIGMEHNQNKDSLLYPYTTKDAIKLTPTADDLTELNRVCQKQTIVNVILERLQRIKIQTTSN